MQRATGCVAQIPLAFCRAGGQRSSSNIASPWLGSELAVVPVG